MNVQLIGSKILDLSFSKIDVDIKEIEFEFGNAFSSESLDSFIVDFKLTLKVEDDFSLKVHHVSQFKADIDIQDKDKSSPFFSINAPAIAYPFLRAYVANFLLSSGFDPALLPTINFVELSKKNKDQSKLLKK